jgi:Flp pilus assembly protein TadD
MALEQKGITSAELGKYDEAIQAYDNAIELDLKYADARNNKGIILDKLGKFDEATGLR